MNEAKQEIIATRTGCLGGSDARLIQSIAEAGKIPQSAMKRLAICKGLAEQPQFTNPAIEFGNYVESMVFESLHSQDEHWQSNPCLVSTKYSRPNCKVIDHVDFFLQDDEKKVLVLGECKGTRSTYEQTYDEYKWQLLHHYLLGCEKAKELGGYKVKVMLCHYLTDGIDLTQPFEFDPSRLTVKTLRNMEKLSKSYHISEAMDIIDNFLETFTEYYEQDEIDANLLPANVQSQFSEVAQFLKEIKEREVKIDAFKAKLYDFLSERGIKKVACDDFSFTVVAPTQQVSVDYKNLFIQEIEAKRPRVARQLKEKYKKTTNKKGYVVIKTSNNNND
jgi:hypothetical protein